MHTQNKPDYRKQKAVDNKPPEPKNDDQFSDQPTGTGFPNYEPTLYSWKLKRYRFNF